MSSRARVVVVVIVAWAILVGAAGVRAAPASGAFPGKAAPGTGPDLWAVLVGVQNYHGSTHHTYGGRSDVDVFGRLLGRAAWPADHVLTLLDDDATAANIRSAMDWLVDHSSPSTFSVFHYSGHVCQSDVGPCASGHRYLWGVDNQFIANDEFSQTMQKLRGRAWIDISGCEAADFDHGVSNADRLFTASSQTNEKSYEDKGWHESVWTGLLVDQGMLQGKADSDGDGTVTIGEAFPWAAPQATAITEGESKGAQHPYAVGGQGSWAVPTPAPPPQAPQHAPPPPPPPAPKPCTSLNALLRRC